MRTIFKDLILASCGNSLGLVKTMRKEVTHVDFKEIECEINIAQLYQEKISLDGSSTLKKLAYAFSLGPEYK